MYCLSDQGYKHHYREGWTREEVRGERRLSKTAGRHDL